MAEGPRIQDVQQSSRADYFLALTDNGLGLQGPRRVSAANVGAQLAVGAGRVFATWAALALVSGTKAGERAEVRGDHGSHTDPVTGANIPDNSGVYGWSTAPIGWRWLDNDTLAGLDTRLTAEEAARIAADTTETTARTDDVADLQSQISALGGSLVCDGDWNASTNSPTLASGVGTEGHYRIVSTTGTTTLDGVSSWSASDWALFSGGAWKRISGQSVATKIDVSPVSGQTIININAADEVGAPPYRGTYYRGLVDDGPSSESPQTYYIHDYIFGWNVGAGGSRILSSEPAWYMHFESKFREQPGHTPFHSEFHIAMTDMTNVVRRPFSVSCTHDGVSRIQHQNTANRISWNRPNGTNFMILDASDPSHATISGQMVFSFDRADPRWGFVLNAARNAYLNLPFYDSVDVLSFDKGLRLPVYTVSLLPAAATVGAGVCAFAGDLAGSVYVYGATAVGGGSRGGKVFSDGAAWREG